MQSGKANHSKQRFMRGQQCMRKIYEIARVQWQMVEALGWNFSARVFVLRSKVPRLLPGSFPLFK